MISPKSAIAILSFCALILLPETVWSQTPCTTLGQTPSTAFPVCGTSTFHQAVVPLCSTNFITVPGCTAGPGDPGYENRNPFFYKFTCYVAGTLGFTVTPLAANEDYDWQLWDITGVDPNTVFTNASLVVTGNWAGTYGPTGASATGVSFIQCGSDPSPPHEPTFAAMPTLIVDHVYLLMISHFTNTQSGYDLSFSGGTAVITDPKEPHLASAVPSCDGSSITVKLNKNMKCSSLTSTGSEFTISPGTHVITSVTTNNCTTGFDFTELTITLQNPLPNNNYTLTINNGTDANTVRDNCDRDIPQGEQVNFIYAIPGPIFADSLGKVGCAPEEVRVYFPKKISCNTIAPDGSDFAVTGPSTVTVASAGGLNCVNGKSDVVVVRFTAPIVVGGNYQLTLKAGTDGTTIIDECGIPAPVHSLPFVTADTVSAEFTYIMNLDCESNTLNFSHNGAHNVNSWDWTFNDLPHVATQTHTIVFPSSSTNNVSLIVTNGTCSDTASETIVMDNEVNADFTMPDIICPEDLLKVENESTGLIDVWQWDFDVISNSNQEDPAPVQFPHTNVETYYNVRLIATNNTLGCSDTMTKNLRVLNNCYIAVPTGFTPNGDGLNDYLYPNNAFKADNLKFSVFNRWGQLVFTTRNWQHKWDGRIKGVLQGSDVFVWYLEYTHRDTGQKVFQKGTTMLIR
jgi:gliding motility-associated-like protein